MKELIQKIEQWASDRNIIKGSTPLDQSMKLFSEFGELADNVGKGRDCRDDIGDIFVVLTIMTAQHGKCIHDYMNNPDAPYFHMIKDTKEAVVQLSYSLNLFSNKGFSDSYYPITSCLSSLEKVSELCGVNLIDCVQIAYDDIKNRKGILSNGVFVKEDDPAYASIIASIESNCE